MQPKFAILNPCSKRWADLSGEGQARFCETCHTPVHPMEEYSAEEWRAVWTESGGHVCGLLAGESTPEPRSRRVVLIGALLTAISPLMAQSGRVRIRVTDPTGAVVPEALVSLLGSDDKPAQSWTTSVLGEVVLTDLPLGDNRLAIVYRGFATRRLTVTVRGSEEVKVDAMLEIGLVGEIVPVHKKRWWHRLILR